jgi:hypothetical protein
VQQVNQPSLAPAAVEPSSSEPTEE